MDKRVIFAVAGSGKTTYIVNELSLEKRSLILTYTDGNYDNISRKILAKFGGRWPNSVTLMTYFSFLYNFCYKPYFADIIHAKGIVFDNNPNIKIPQDSMRYYLSPSGLLYSNRLAFFLERANALPKIKRRIERYYDELVIDEIQDMHKNWGETKGEDKYTDVCVLLNKTTSKKMAAGKLAELAPMTKNKLYVAITRAKGNVYIFDE